MDVQRTADLGFARLDLDRAHDGGGDTLAPAAPHSAHVWTYEVLEYAGPKVNQENQG